MPDESAQIRQVPPERGRLIRPPGIRALPVRQITLARLAVAALLLGLLWMLSEVVLLVFFAALLATVLRGTADWLAERFGWRASWTLAALVIALACVAVGLGYWIGPSLVKQAQDLGKRLTEEWGTLRQHFAQSSAGQSVLQQVNRPQDLAGNLAVPAKQALTLSLRTLIDLVILLVITLYFAASPEQYVRGALALVPIPYRARLREVMVEIGHVLRFWMLGQLVDMVVVGVLSATGLWLAGVPVPVALGALAALLTFVPYFGAIAAAVPSILVAMTVSWSTALWALAVYTLCHCVDAYAVSPLVQRRLVELPPALTVMAMTVLGSVFGPLGVILGTPLAAAGLVAVRRLYVHDVLGDPEAAS